MSSESVTRDLTVSQALELALDLHRQGRLQEAAALYQGVLSINPEHPDALHYFAVLCHQVGQGGAALALLRRAADLTPDHPDVFNNLGNVLHSQGRGEEAVMAYEKVMSLRPDDANACNNLGVALKDQGRLEEAVRVLEKALELDPQLAAVHCNLAHVLYRLNRFDEAARHYQITLELKVDDGTAYRNLSASLYRAGQPERSREVYREWLHVDPNPLARHMLAALSQAEVPQRASDDYIRNVFDSFAHTFDRRLADLEYRAPQYVASALARLSGDRLRVVLDAGCGTGLCAPLLRPLARLLVGVDLSAVMLEKARQRGGYDELLEAELTTFLEQTPDRWEAVVSADTLVYFGALEAFVVAARAALKPDGLLVFTVEKAASQEAPPGYRLNVHGRYSHSAGYLRQVLGDAGFQEVELEEVELRLENASPVSGYLVTARRP